MPRVALVAHWDWVLYNFRLPLAKALRERGHEVVFVCPFGEYVRGLQEEGFSWFHWNLERRGLNPLKELRALLHLAALYRTLAPDLVHHFTIKPNLYGTMAARLADVPAVINTFTGLGYLFSSQCMARFLRTFIIPLLRWAFRTPNVIIAFQNERDRQALIRLTRVSPDKTVVIPGSGVDTCRFSPENQQTRTQESPTRIVLTAARLLSDKGIFEFVEAAKCLRANGVRARFWLAGAPDKGNPACISDSLLEEWRKGDAVELLGHHSDMPNLLRQADIAVLATSYNEGVPMFLLEAAATGLPLIATDIEGCKMVVQHGINGFLIPERDSGALVKAIEVLLRDPILRQRMGRASRTLAQVEFDERRIVGQYLDLYQKLGVVPAG